MRRISSSRVSTFYLPQGRIERHALEKHQPFFNGRKRVIAAIAVFIGVVLVVTIAWLFVRGRFQENGVEGAHESAANALAKRKKFERSYSHVLVNDCIERTPKIGGKTYEAVVNGVGVSFVSWTENASVTRTREVLRTFDTVRIMAKFDRPATLLDVGANVGKVSFPVMSMAETHTVVAIEPVKKNMDHLCMTANLNGWLGHPGLILIQAAMSDRSGDMKIYVPEGREDNAALDENAATANVRNPNYEEVVHIIDGDSLLQEGGFEPDVIKIDVQGHEIHVLRGLQRYLIRAKNVVVIAESDPKLMKESGVNPMDIYELMVTQLGYTPYLTANVTVSNGVLKVEGTILDKDLYPPHSSKDITYFRTQ